MTTPTLYDDSMTTLHEVQITLEEMQLPQQDRVKLAHWLLDSVVNPAKALVMSKGKTADAPNERLTHFLKLDAEVNQISQTILARRNGQPIDVDMIWDAVKDEQDERHDDIFGL